MLSGLIVATLALAGTIAFNSAFAFSGVHKAYLGLYKGIVERNVYVVASGDGYADKPYIDLIGLKEDLTDYFRVNLRPYCRHYSFSLTGGEDTLTGRINAVRIDLDTQLTLTWRKQFRAIFTIERNENHG